MREIRTEIEMDAPAEHVWEVLTDFGGFAEWNPFIPSLRGEAYVGARLEVKIVSPGGRGMVFRPVVTRAESARAFAWLGRLFVPGLFDGEHCFELEPLGPSRCRFVQRETFSGLLVPLLGGTLRRARDGFEAMNRALKARAEASPTG